MVLKIEYFETPANHPLSSYYRISDGKGVDEYYPTMEDVVNLVELNNLSLYTYLMSDEKIAEFKSMGVDIDRFK